MDANVRSSGQPQESLVFHLAAAATVCWALGSYNWDKEVSPIMGQGLSMASLL